MGIKEEFEKIPVPEELDTVIDNAITKVKRESILFNMKVIITSISFIIAFVVVVNAVPAFADTVQNIPLLSYITDAVTIDKGIKSAVDNNINQNQTSYDEHDGIRFTVDNTIMDEKNMLIFYSIKSKNPNGYSLVSAELIGKDTKNMQFASLLPISKKSKEKDIFYGQVNIEFFQKPLTDDVLNLKVKLLDNVSFTKQNDENQIKGPINNALENKVWSINIKNDKKIFERPKYVYSINKTISIENQKLTFNKLTVYPTIAELDVTTDPSNTKEIRNLKDLKIVYDDGESYEFSTDFGARFDGNHQTYYIQSNYFSSNKKFSIMATGIQVIDKSKSIASIDLKSKKVIGDMNGQIVLDDVIYKEKTIKLVYHVKNDTQYDIFCNGFDDSNNHYITEGGGTETDDKNQVHFYMILPRKDYKGMLKFSIDNFPAFIDKEIKIDISIK